MTEAEVKRMRERYADGVSKSNLATSFQVCEETVTLHVQGIPRNRIPCIRGRKGGFARALRRAQEVS